MATITKTIGTGKDFTTLSALVNAIQNNQGGLSSDFVSNTQIVIAEIYDQILDSVVISGLTTSTSYYLHIKAAPRWRHNGYREFGARIVGDTGGILIDISAAHVIIDSLIIGTDDDDTNTCLRIDGASIVQVEQCIFLGESSGTGKSPIVHVNASSGNPDLYLLSCFFYASNVLSSNEVIKVESAASRTADLFIANCTLIGSQTGRTGGTPVGPAYGVQLVTVASSTSTVTARNNIGANMGTAAWASTGSGTKTFQGNYNFDNDGSSVSKFGGASATFTVAAMYLSATILAGNEDGHLLNDSPFTDNGQDSATSPTTLPSWPSGREDKDVRHEVRNGTIWSSGAYQFPEFLKFRYYQDQTNVPVGFNDPGKAVVYDGPNRSYMFNKILYRLDRMLTEDTSENTRLSNALTSAETGVTDQRPNLLVNPSFDWWNLGTSFADAQSSMTADAWVKNDSAKVTRISSPSSYGSYALQLEFISTAPPASTRVEQKVRWYGNDAKKSISFSCGVRCSATSVARIGLKAESDGDFTYSSYHTGTGATERLVVNIDLDSTDEFAVVLLESDTRDPNITAVFFECMLVFEKLSYLPYVPKDHSIDLLGVHSLRQKYSTIYEPTSKIRTPRVMSLPTLIPIPLRKDDDLQTSKIFVEADRFLTEGSGAQPYRGTSFSQVQFSSQGTNDISFFIPTIAFRRNQSPPKEGNTQIVNMLLKEQRP